MLAGSAGAFVWMNAMMGQTWIGWNQGQYITYSWIALAAAIATLVNLLNDWECANSIINGKVAGGFCGNEDTGAAARIGAAAIYN